MEKYTIDLKNITTKDQFHDEISRTLQFPEYYGRNLDALHDLISTMYIGKRVQFDFVGVNTLPTELQDYCSKAVNIFTRVSKETYKTSDSSIFIVNKS